MDLKRFTLIAGIVFVAIGLLGYVPAFVTYAPTPSNDPFLAHGMLFGIFPVNGIHNLLHVGFGIWALAVWKNVKRARIFCRSNAVIYGLLAVAGFIPGLNTLWGLLPMYGHDIWLHAVIALATGYFGFVWHSREHTVDQLRPSWRNPV